jgi:hypothetical protein
MDKFLLVEQKGASGPYFDFNDGSNNGTGYGFCVLAYGFYNGNGCGIGYGTESGYGWGNGWGNGNGFSPMTVSGAHFGLGCCTVSTSTRGR